jgi:hypothetical protein
MWHAWGTGEVHTGLWWGDLRKGDLDVDGRIILRWILKQWNEEAWSGLSGSG